MKLISTLSMKSVACVLFMFASALSFGRIHSATDTRRVFWNKFDVAQGKDNVITLTWNVTEYNNKSFAVQHSVDGKDWEDIAFVQSKNSPESITDYSYSYVSKTAGKQYFRLKDIDVDLGTTGYSPVKTLDIKKEKQTAGIWPNPVNTYVTISNDENIKYTKAKILDLSGKVVVEKALDTEVTEVALTQLAAGIYIIRMENDKGMHYSQKIVKQ